MSDCLCIVQFPHPQREHELTSYEKKATPLVKEWNNGQHRRKFLRAKGMCVSDNNILSEEKDILFWGEWEPYSEVEILHGNTKNPKSPMYVHKPFLKVKKNGNLHYYIHHQPKAISESDKAKLSCTDRSCIKSNRSNTDPFVFGNYFIYSCCRQFTKNKENGNFKYSSMKSLQKGSLILFGSSFLNPQGEDPYFALDTVFVVGESRLFHVKSHENDLAGFIPPYYAEIMGYGNWDGNPEMRCYHGATIDDPINGMYSFVPCKSCSSDTPSWGFERPKLRASMFESITDGSKDIINVNSFRNFRIFGRRYCAFINEKLIHQVWQIVRQQVINQDYEIGVKVNYEIH